MLNYILEIDKAITERKKLSDYDSKNWFLKLFNKKPILTTKSPEEIAKIYTESLTRFYFDSQNGNYVKVYVCWNESGEGTPYFPVVIYRALVDGCFYISRQAFDEKGNTHEWGCSYPESECGVTGLYGEINSYKEIPVEFKNAEIFFKKLINEITKQIKNK